MFYRCYFLSADNRIKDTAEFQGADDPSALTEARRLFAAQKDYAGFELWEGGRRVHTEFPGRSPR